MFITSNQHQPPMFNPSKTLAAAQQMSVYQQQGHQPPQHGYIQAYNYMPQSPSSSGAGLVYSNNNNKLHHKLMLLPYRMAHMIRLIFFFISNIIK
jgi:hypothetical protein